jgi:hypothetical protein
MNKDPDPSKSTPSDNTKLKITFTMTTELAADSTVSKSYFAKVMAESSQQSWHIDSGAIYFTTPDKA